MSKISNFWDNAVAESFFAILKKERVFNIPITKIKPRLVLILLITLAGIITKDYTVR
jgi:transposase InsO family protein